MVRVLSFVLLLVPSLLGAQTVTTDTTPRPIELNEAVRLARRNSPASVQARGDMRISRVAIKSAYLAFLPTLSVGAGRSWLGGSILNERREIFQIPEKTTYGDNFSARAELFDGGRRFFGVRTAYAQSNAAEATDVVQEYQVTLDVKRQYYDVLAAREAEEAGRAQLAEADQQLRVATVRVAAGAASRSDSLRAVVSVGNARLAILDAQNRVQLANASLTRLVGAEFPVTAVPDESPDPTTDMLDQGRLLTLAEDGPGVNQAEARLAAARAAARAERTLYLPTIIASYGRSGNGFDQGFGTRDPFAYLSQFNLSLNFTLFDGLQREERVVRANVATDNAEATLRDTRLRAQQELTQSLGLLRNAGQRVEVQTTSVAATEQDLRFQQQRYALGAATLLDVLTSQAALNTARNNLITARFDQRVARARLEALIGRPLELER